MPELPEVETIARGLAKRVTGDVIESVWLGQKKEPLKSPAPEIVAALEQSRIVSVHRMGKHIVFDLERDNVGRALPSAGSGQALPASLWPDPTILRIPAISAFSGSGTAHSLYPRAKSATRNPVPVTFDYPPSVTPKWSPASLTGGTQFVTVNQSFTKPLAELSSASAWNCRRAGKFQALVAVLGRCRARESLHSQDGSVARKSQVVRTGVSAT